MDVTGTRWVPGAVWHDHVPRNQPRAVGRHGAPYVLVDKVHAVFVSALGVVVALGIVQPRARAEGRRVVTPAVQPDCYQRARVAHIRHDLSVLHRKDEGKGRT